jgi:hypothetical protein
VRAFGNNALTLVPAWDATNSIMTVTFTAG